MTFAGDATDAMPAVANRSTTRDNDCAPWVCLAAQKLIVTFTWNEPDSNQGIVMVSARMLPFGCNVPLTVTDEPTSRSEKVLAAPFAVITVAEFTVTVWPATTKVGAVIDEI